MRRSAFIFHLNAAIKSHSSSVIVDAETAKSVFVAVTEGKVVLTVCIVTLCSFFKLFQRNSINITRVKEFSNNNHLSFE